MKNIQCSLSNKVLFQNSKYSIEQYVNCNTGLQNIVIVKDKTFTEFPILCLNDTLGFDFPERLPEYIKIKVRKLYLKIRK
jgi:hypothetical protein